MILETEDLRVAYGPIEAVKGLSLKLDEGQLVTIVGANGAGKSTTIGALSGEIRPASGEIRFRGRAISRMAPHEIARLGIVQCPEAVSYTHFRAHETPEHLVCRLQLEKKKNISRTTTFLIVNSPIHVST